MYIIFILKVTAKTVMMLNSNLNIINIVLNIVKSFTVEPYTPKKKWSSSQQSPYGYTNSKKFHCSEPYISTSIEIILFLLL